MRHGSLVHASRHADFRSDLKSEAALRVEDRHQALLRFLDVAVAVLLLAALLPLMLVVAAIIRLHDSGPAMFSQQRVGCGGRTFQCLKFRTMVIDAEERLCAYLAADPEARSQWEADQKLRNDPRITSLGRLLRKSSFDELPQLFNVLRGQMSMVGPRPIVHSEITRYGRWYLRYCAVQPGITGLWQVSGRNDTSYRRRVACDVLYARRRSLSVNLKILAGTLPAVLRGRGCY